MATYKLKRKHFSLGAVAGKTLGLLGGASKNATVGNKVMGGIAVAGIGSTSISGSKERKENAEQSQQALQEQKEKLNQLNNVAKS